MSTSPRNTSIQPSGLHLSNIQGVPIDDVSSPGPNGDHIFPPRLITAPIPHALLQSVATHPLFPVAEASPSSDSGDMSHSLSSPVPICLSCRFDQIIPYIPHINAEAVLHSGPSPAIKALVPAIMQDILPLHISPIDASICTEPSFSNKVQREIELHDAALAPIQTFPVDLLLDIFMLVPVNTLKPLSSPWIFGHICASWRSLSLSTLSLWSRIIIDDFHGLSGPKVEAALEIYLSRSIAHPLTICLDSLPFPDPTRDSDPITHLSTITAHASRWTAVHLDMTSSQLTKLLEMIQEPPYHIRILEMYMIKDTDDGQSCIPYKPVFSLSPIAHGTIYGISTSMFPLFFGNLTTFCCDLNEPSKLPSILEQATDLETLHIVPEPSAGPSNLLESNSGRKDIFFPWFPSASTVFLYQDYGSLNLSHMTCPISRSCLCLIQEIWLGFITCYGDRVTALQLFHDLSAKRDTPGKPTLIDSILLPNLQRLTVSEEPSAGTDIGMMKFIGALYNAVLSCSDCPDVKQLTCLKLILIGQSLQALRHNPATGFGLLHLIELKSFISKVAFIVGGDDILEADGWLELLVIELLICNHTSLSLSLHHHSNPKIFILVEVFKIAEVQHYGDLNSHLKWGLEKMPGCKRHEYDQLSPPSDRQLGINLSSKAEEIQVHT
ncbi:hypothetical protein ARMGADRAFT_1031913 [Armillaria gallica]|uniref:F-box domain-containing protein n=1 Tax=Armillaria gallica TaxID=47427 RepID=A0A2H3D7N3_ARMGA|nr:hypothetical protein ARMGADRAFT_1031913 [Armillaria gallica]